MCDEIGEKKEKKMERRTQKDKEKMQRIKKHDHFFLFFLGGRILLDITTNVKDDRSVQDTNYKRKFMNAIDKANK